MRIWTPPPSKNLDPSLERVGIACITSVHLCYSLNANEKKLSYFKINAILIIHPDVDFYLQQTYILNGLLLSVECSVVVGAAQVLDVGIRVS